MAEQAQDSPDPKLPKRLPLVVIQSNRDDSTDKDARLVNCFMEIPAKDSPDKDTWIIKRPGLLDSGTGQAASTGRGVFNWRGNVYSIFGATLYKNGTSVGTVDTTNGVYRFDSCLGDTPPVGNVGARMVLANGVYGYFYDATAGLGQISDVDFPTAFTKGWAFLDLTTYVMDTDANIQGSGLSNVVDWDPVNSLQAQIEPDAGIALAKQLVNVIALKAISTEIFYDAGNSTGSPLGRVAGAKVNYGCISSDSVQSIDGILMWLANSPASAPSVMMMENLKAQTVSTKPVEKLLTGLDYTTVYSWQLKLAGHKFYVLTIKNANLTLAFDLVDRMWCQWTDASGNYFPIVASTFDSSMRHILQHESNGILYYASMDYTNDNGGKIVADIYTPNYDGGVDRVKYLSQMKFVADQQAGSSLMVRSSDDDYTTWNSFRSVDLGQPSPVLGDEGSFYRRAYNFRHESNTPLRLKAVDMHVDLGVL